MAIFNKKWRFPLHFSCIAIREIERKRTNKENKRKERAKEKYRCNWSCVKNLGVAVLSGFFLFFFFGWVSVCQGFYTFWSVHNFQFAPSKVWNMIISPTQNFAQIDPKSWSLALWPLTFQYFEHHFPTHTEKRRRLRGNFYLLHQHHQDCTV